MKDREAESRLLAVEIRMNKIIFKIPQKEEIEYFSSNLLKKSRTPQFYDMKKVHKNNTPVPLQLVVSKYSSLLGISSTYQDFKIQPLTRLVQSYLTSSQHVITLLQQIGKVTTSARIFT